MKLDMNFKFKNLDGTYDDTTKPAVLLANLLSGKTDNLDPLKAMPWAYELSASGIINPDKADLDEIEKVVRTAVKAGTIGNIGAAPLLEAIKAAKEPPVLKKVDIEPAS